MDKMNIRNKLQTVKINLCYPFPIQCPFTVPKSIWISLFIFIRICKKYYRKLEEMLFHFLKNIKIFI